MKPGNDLTSAVGSELAGAGAPDQAARARSSWTRPLGWLLAIALLAGCLVFLDIDKVLAAVRRLTPEAIAVVLALMTADRFLMAYKWHWLLQLLEVRLPFAAILRIYYQATFSSVLLPPQFGGDVAAGSSFAPAAVATAP